MTKKMVCVSDFEDSIKGLTLYKATLIQRRHYFKDQLKAIEIGVAERGVGDRSPKEVVAMVKSIDDEIDYVKNLIAVKRAENPKVKMQIIRVLNKDVINCGNTLGELVSLKHSLMQRKHNLSVALMNVDRGELVGDGTNVYVKDDLEAMLDGVARDIFIVNDRLFDIRHGVKGGTQ